MENNGTSLQSVNIFTGIWLIFFFGGGVGFLNSRSCPVVAAESGLASGREAIFPSAIALDFW